MLWEKEEAEEVKTEEEEEEMLQVEQAARC